MKIKEISSREILSSGAKPTMETKVTLEDGIQAKASVPFGASDGSHEAFILLDGDKKRYLGSGMLKAVNNVNTILASAIIGIDVTQQEAIDKKLLELDGTENKSKLGANAILSVSLACARAASFATHTPLYKYIRETYHIALSGYELPKPLMVVLEGGQHADHSTDIQEYLIAPFGNKSLKECVRMGSEVYQTLKKVLEKSNLNTNVGNEGAYAPNGIESNAKGFELILTAIEQAGYKLNTDVGLGIDAAASEFFKNGKYVFNCEGKNFSSDEIIALYHSWIDTYHLFLVEDGLAEDDWDSWIKLKKDFPKDVIIVGDDLTVTDATRLQRAIDLDCMNSILIKPNQIGTLTETIETMQLANKNNMKTIVSHRGGGETNDTFIIDLAVAAGAKFVKVGPSRGERVEKYNRLMEIEDELLEG